MIDKAKHAAAQAAFEKRRKDAGWKRHVVWVPPGVSPEFRKAMDRLRRSRLWKIGAQTED